MKLPFGITKLYTIMLTNTHHIKCVTQTGNEIDITTNFLDYGGLYMVYKFDIEDDGIRFVNAERI